MDFNSDYLEGAHPAILQRLTETNAEQAPGYGADRFTAEGAAKVAAACGCPAAQVQFLVGGTQTNAVVIGALLGDCEAVIGAASAHINGHEAGAIEYTGHKVIALPAHDGKLCAEELRAYLEDFYASPSYEHSPIPGMVYVTHPTEIGTLYTKAELTALAEVCRAYALPLYMDGARLAYGLATPGTDVTLRDIASLCDVFYIGGTKCGALLGEAVVFPRGDMPRHFLTSVKKRGALLEKGRVLGLTFSAFFETGAANDLYYQIGAHGVQMAQKLRAVLKKHGVQEVYASPTNQTFAVMDNARIAALAPQVQLSLWEKVDAHHTVVRLVTSWATSEEAIQELDRALSDLKG